MAEFKPITTQEQFDEAIRDRISRAETKAAEKYANHISPEAFAQKTAELNQKITDLTKTIEEGKTKSGESSKTIADLEKKLKGYETASVKTKIAAEMGLPYELASRLNGETEEEIRKDAEVIKTFVSQKKTAPLHNPEGGAGNSKDAALLGMLREMKGDK